MRNLLAVLMLVVLLAAAPASLFGIDEPDGQNVLTNDVHLQLTARVQPAAGSPEDKTVGSVETVSQTCAPHLEGQQR